MLNEKQASAVLKGFVTKYGAAQAAERFLAKHPEMKEFVDQFFQAVGVKEQEAQPVEQHEVREETKRRGRAPSGDSKIARAVEIYKNNMGLRRKEIIQLFKDQLNMTDAGASTYYVIARKKLGISKADTQ